jgi:transcription initiation factor IIE alpha subunit
MCKNTKIIISEYPNIDLALKVIKDALKQKISKEIDDINVDDEKMEEHRCYLFSLEDIEKYLVER